MENLFQHQATLAAFLVFFVPGFLMIQVYELMVPSPRRDFSKSVFEAVAYSAVNLGAFSPVIYLMRSGFFSPFWYWVCVTIILVFAPIAWSAIFLWARKSEWFRKVFPHPILCPWDYVFGQKQWSWIIVHLNGRKIGGLFGSKSFASSYPAEPQIYLQEVWELDERERFIKRIDQSKGMLFFAKDIVAIELFQYDKEGEATCQRETAENSRSATAANQAI